MQVKIEVKQPTKMHVDLILKHHMFKKDNASQTFSVMVSELEKSESTGMSLTKSTHNNKKI